MNTSDGVSRSPTRTEAFSDGVLAIVITLLVLEIRVPHLHDALSRREAWDALRALTPKFASFVLSFVYVAIFWVNHHHFFDLIRKVNPGLIWRNNLLLLFLCFVPFPTAFIGEYPSNPVGLALFAVVLMAAGLVFTVMWHYAHRKRLMDPRVPDEVAKQAVKSGMMGPPLYAFATLGAFASPWIAWTVFFIVPVFFFFHSKRKLDEALSD